MRNCKFITSLTIAIIFSGLILALPVRAQSTAVRSSATIKLGETPVKINIYEKAGSNINMFAPHHNEHLALALAKAALEERGGRLVEIESFDGAGKPARRLSYRLGGKSYSVDPNRIFTENGRTCAGLSEQPRAAVSDFAKKLLNIIFDPGDEGSGKRKFLVAVHNNSDSGPKSAIHVNADLNASAFAGEINPRSLGRTEFQDQADGVYFSNSESDADNFVFLSTPNYIGYFAARGFNVVVQKTLNRTDDKRCSVDDGSLSVYSAQNEISYLCLEADAKNGAARQKKMLDAVYDLIAEDNEPKWSASSNQGIRPRQKN